MARHQVMRMPLTAVLGNSKINPSWFAMYNRLFEHLQNALAILNKTTTRHEARRGSYYNYRLIGRQRGDQIYRHGQGQGCKYFGVVLQWKQRKQMRNNIVLIAGVFELT